LGVFMSVIDRFEEWCRSKGGKAERDKYVKSVSCKFPDYLGDEEVREFMRFVDANRRDLRKEDYDVCVEYEEKLIGGYREGEEVCYFPSDDRIHVGAKYYSDYGVSGELMGGLPKSFTERKTVDAHRITFGKEMDVEWNDATDEWMGLGNVGASIGYRVAKKNPDIVVKMLDKAKEDAAYYANEALDYIKPAEEEEEEYL